MKTIYEKPEFNVLETMVSNVITASAGQEPPKKVNAQGAQQAEETGVSWGSMW